MRRFALKFGAAVKWLIKFGLKEEKLKHLAFEI